MGTATATLVDNNGTFATLTFSHAETGAIQPTVSPTPSEWDEEGEREIVDHGIPTREGDIGQDMGAHSAVFSISGLCTIGDKAALEARWAVVQFTTDCPSGRITLTVTSSASITIFIKSDLAFVKYRFKNLAGRPKWVRYYLVFKQYTGQE